MNNMAFNTQKFDSYYKKPKTGITPDEEIWG